MGSMSFQNVNQLRPPNQKRSQIPIHTDIDTSPAHCLPTQVPQLWQTSMRPIASCCGPCCKGAAVSGNAPKRHPIQAQKRKKTPVTTHTDTDTTLRSPCLPTQVFVAITDAPLQAAVAPADACEQQHRAEHPKDAQFRPRKGKKSRTCITTHAGVDTSLRSPCLPTQVFVANIDAPLQAAVAPAAKKVRQRQAEQQLVRDRAQGQQQQQQEEQGQDRDQEEDLEPRRQRQQREHLQRQEEEQQQQQQQQQEQALGYQGTIPSPELLHLQRSLAELEGLALLAGGDVGSGFRRKEEGSQREKGSKWGVGSAQRSRAGDRSTSAGPAHDDDDGGDDGGVGGDVIMETQAAPSLGTPPHGPSPPSFATPPLLLCSCTIPMRCARHCAAADRTTAAYAVPEGKLQAQSGAAQHLGGIGAGIHASAPQPFHGPSVGRGSSQEVGLGTQEDGLGTDDLFLATQQSQGGGGGGFGGAGLFPGPGTRGGGGLHTGTPHCRGDQGPECVLPHAQPPRFQATAAVLHAAGQVVLRPEHVRPPALPPRGSQRSKQGASMPNGSAQQGQLGHVPGSEERGDANGVGREGRGTQGRGAGATVRLSPEALNAYLSLMDDWPDPDLSFGSEADAKSLFKVCSHHTPAQPQQQQAAPQAQQQQQQQQQQRWQPLRPTTAANASASPTAARPTTAPLAAGSAAVRRRGREQQQHHQHQNLQGGIARSSTPGSAAARGRLSFGRDVGVGGALGDTDQGGPSSQPPPKSVTFDLSQPEPAFPPHSQLSPGSLWQLPDMMGTQASGGGALGAWDVGEAGAEHPSQTVPFFSSQQSVLQVPGQQEWQPPRRLLAPGGAPPEPNDVGATAGGLPQAPASRQQQQQQQQHRKPAVRRKRKLGGHRALPGYSEGF
ncbi:hypothetical protein DUNSADRAFT_5984 [Dunaliella salina]|uniref:Uncharacterized protein n=1 Tax=Dunaliella salina TaxID=3046 RepID=A0ABQ7GP80_DUNSA|nr:hypothetical protein DUNSADRAFT_5984 [Dunaliella salina]|eukprot:KAF5836414.1 hypothetical protein DUNSADRAFT_5984 [Dunaliella salina]